MGALNPMTGAFVREGEGDLDTDTYGGGEEGHAKTEAEIRMTCL